jgi:hypothetical protein
MTATFDNAAKALAALDFSKEQGTVSQLLAESAKIAEAIERANVRLGEIGFILNSRSPESEAGREVADSLLAGTEPGQAAALATASREALLIERGNLSAGLSDLRRRENAIGLEVKAVQDSARARLAEPLEPVIAELMVQATAAADTLANAYAALEGLSIATRHGSGEAAKLGQAVARLRDRGLIEAKQRLPVPDGVAELLAPLAKVGEALPVNVPAWVSSPDDLAAMTLVAGMEARRAVG